MAETLARLAERALLRGVRQGYVPREEELMVLRGRIRTSAQMSRHQGAVIPLEVAYDEYDVDTPENRILRAALVRVAGLPRLDRRLRGRLQHLLGRLTGVTALRRGTPLPPWRPSRLNSDYQPALRLSELILRTIGGEGASPTASFVVDMAKVFEDFVSTALGESLQRRSAGATHTRYRDVLDEDGTVPIRPDIVHTIGGRPVAVLDAKYKLGTEGDAYPTADVFQMTAYCAALGLPRGTLVYAGSRGDRSGPRVVRIRNLGIEIELWPLDVSAAPRELLTQVDVLAQHVDAGVAVGLQPIAHTRAP